jgi:hypothetical protein
VAAEGRAEGSPRRRAAMAGGGDRGWRCCRREGARPGQDAARLGSGGDGATPRGFTRHWRGARR